MASADDGTTAATPPPPSTPSPCDDPAPRVTLKDRLQARWRLWCVELLVVVAVFVAITLWQTRHHLDTGTPAPDFTLRTLEGDVVRLAEHRGRSVLLAFWAPWCTVCELSASNLADLAQARGEEVHILPVALSFEDVASVRDFAQAHDLPNPVLLGTPEVARAFRVKAFPTYYILSPQGEVTHTLVGYTTTWGLRLRL